MKRSSGFFVLLLALLLLNFAPTSSAQETKTHRVLLIVLDGLRPDYVTPERMPNLHALGRQGVVGAKHHCVFPTVTRVNASTLATGCYPDKHGLVDNTLYLPEIEPDKGLDAASRGDLERIEEATGGKLLEVPSIGEMLRASGKKMLAISSGSAGSAFLLNHKAPRTGSFEEAGGGIIHNDYTLPETEHARVTEALGPVPEDAEPNAGRNARLVDAYIRFGLDEIKPDVTYMWFSDPDHTAHGAGIGTEKTWESIRLVDAEIGRILKAHEERGLTDKVNIIVTSDHGFSTHTGGWDVKKYLIEKGLKESADSTDVVVFGGMIYVKDKQTENLQAIVRSLIEYHDNGGIFTRFARETSQTPLAGTYPGTFSLSALHYEHHRSPDIVSTAPWDHKEVNGYKGTTKQGGTAGHGSLSPYDVHNTLIAAGPDFKQGVESAVPSGNVDMAPTVCQVIGLSIPAHVQGRVLAELLSNGAAPAEIEVKTEEESVRAWSGHEWFFDTKLHRSLVNGYVYVDFALGEPSFPVP